MPLKKGIGSKIYPNTGRKGYEWEDNHLKEMREGITIWLQLIKKVLTGKATAADYAKLAAISADMRKILDKLHSNPPTDLNIGQNPDLPFIINIIKDNAKS